MKLPPLYEGVLVRRYKRFLADIQTADGLITAHCPNTGAMTGCAEPGMKVWYSLSDNPKRKYPATWEIVDSGNGLCSVNTGRANALVGEALGSGVLTELPDSDGVKAEAPIPEGNGRFDFLIPGDPDTYVEVKSVTLDLGDGQGAFPDAVSARAVKHLHALLARVQAGDRAALVFCAQHCGIQSVSTADHIHPEYGVVLQHVRAEGVEILAYSCTTDLCTMTLHQPIPFQ